MSKRLLIGALTATALAAINSAALAMTQDEAIAAIRQQVGNGEGAAGTGAYAWMAAVALALALVLLAMRWRRSRQTRRPTLNNPARLLREVRRTAGLTRADLRRLRRDAADVDRKTGVKVQNPLVLVLCPSLKGKRRVSTPPPEPNNPQFSA